MPSIPLSYSLAHLLATVDSFHCALCDAFVCRSRQFKSYTQRTVVSVLMNAFTFASKLYTLNIHNSCWQNALHFCRNEIMFIDISFKNEKKIKWNEMKEEKSHLHAHTNWCRFFQFLYLFIFYFFSLLNFSFSNSCTLLCSFISYTQWLFWCGFFLLILFTGHIKWANGPQSDESEKERRTKYVNIWYKWPQWQLRAA